MFSSQLDLTVEVLRASEQVAGDPEATAGSNLTGGTGEASHLSFEEYSRCSTMFLFVELT